MLDRDQLETFATVAEQQSFERAATLLNVTRGAVSQRVKALEESLATILLLRDKPVTPTPAGEVLLRHVKTLRLLEAMRMPTFVRFNPQDFTWNELHDLLAAHPHAAQRAGYSGDQ